jgi:hypothetical protein
VLNESRIKMILKRKDHESKLNKINKTPKMNLGELESSKGQLNAKKMTNVTRYIFGIITANLEKARKATNLD